MKNLNLDKFKYSQEQLDRLFTEGQASILARGANIARHARRMNEGTDEENEHVVDEAMNLMQKLLPSIENIVGICKKYNVQVLDMLQDHLGDMDEEDEDKTVLELGVMILDKLAHGKK